MINALLIDVDEQASALLENQIKNYCPHVSIGGRVSSLENLKEYIASQNANLLFLDVQDSFDKGLKYLQELIRYDLEVIIVSRFKDLAIKAMNSCTSGYIQTPEDLEALLVAIKNAWERIYQKNEQLKSQELIEELHARLCAEDILGIPTTKGLDFFKIGDIIRCQGLQKWTQIITTERSNIISSYNLGEFKKILEPLGFFSPHKSHLINLKHIKHYNREGTVIMSDEKGVPVSKRKKKEFLNRIKHI